MDSAFQDIPNISNGDIQYERSRPRIELSAEEQIFFVETHTLPIRLHRANRLQRQAGIEVIAERAAVDQTVFRATQEAKRISTVFSGKQQPKSSPTKKSKVCKKTFYVFEKQNKNMSDCPILKKRQRSDEIGSCENNDAESGDKSCAHLTDFRIVKVINQNAQQKTIFVHGCYDEVDDNKEKITKDAVLILEKLPFSRESLNEILCHETKTNVILENDIYRTLQLYPKPSCNAIKSTLIYPATSKHIAKYTSQEPYLIKETPNDYSQITLPFISSSAFSLQWVYNILEKKTEAERIVFEDADPDVGFVLLPDMKWNGEQVEDLYLVAIVNRRSIKSLRDLSAEHIPLLENILHKGIAAIESKYSVPQNKLRIYLHYLPSYYHLHVHFTHLQYDAPGISAERAHLLDDVIDNIKTDGGFYQKKTISFVLRQNDDLLALYKTAGKL